MIGRTAVAVALLFASVSPLIAQQYTVSPDGNEVRYRVRERLARLEFPNDAVGKTSAITGGIEFDTLGGVVSHASKFVIDVSSLTSDQQRRDRYLRMRTLRTEEFPTMEFLPTAVEGLTYPIPESGEFTFALIGNLVVQRASHPIRWTVTARQEHGVISGTAITTTTFDAIGLKKPSLAMLLDVGDNIGLEYDFRLTPAP